MSDWQGRAKAFDGQWYPVRFPDDDRPRVEWLGGEVSRDVLIELFVEPGPLFKWAAQVKLSELVNAGYWRVFLVPPPIPLEATP